MCIRDRYSPENIDGSSSEQRDIFAVLRMSCEFLGLEWGKESNAYPRISDAVQSELDDLEFGFRDLGRFKKALTTADEVQEQQYVEITLTSINEQMTILPDNGHLYVKVETPKQGKKMCIRDRSFGGGCGGQGDAGRLINDPIPEGRSCAWACVLASADCAKNVTEELGEHSG